MLSIYESTDLRGLYRSCSVDVDGFFASASLFVPFVPSLCVASPLLIDSLLAFIKRSRSCKQPCCTSVRSYCDVPNRARAIPRVRRVSVFGLTQRQYLFPQPIFCYSKRHSCSIFDVSPDAFFCHNNQGVSYYYYSCEPCSLSGCPW